MEKEEEEMITNTQCSIIYARMDKNNESVAPGGEVCSRGRIDNELLLRPSHPKFVINFLIIRSMIILLWLSH